MRPPSAVLLASACLVPIVVALACARGGVGQRVGVVNEGDDPPTGTDDPAPPHVHHDDTMDLPADAQLVEPSPTALTTPTERALVHIHTPTSVCSGAIVGDRLVLTAHQCVGNAAGIVAEEDREKWRVEVASSAVTWTVRHVSYVAIPGCDWKAFDLAMLVIDQPVTNVTPLKMAAAPGEGGDVLALGFGKCPGETRPIGERKGEIIAHERNAVVVDIPLCRGDVGGPLITTATGAVVGVISHQDDDDTAARHTATIFRFDSSAGRKLFADTSGLVDRPEATWTNAVACK